MNAEPLVIIRRHQEITAIFRAMKDKLNLSDEFVDLRGGLTRGHTNKILGPTQSKSWGPTTFDLFCEMFAVEFHVHVDAAALARMAKVWEPRKRPPFTNKTISAELIERAKPHVFKDYGRIGNAARNAMLTREHKSEIASKAARIRWKKHRQTMRERLKARRAAKAALLEQAVALQGQAVAQQPLQIEGGAGAAGGIGAQSMAPLTSL